MFLLAVFIAIIASTNAHLYLDMPVSMGGTGNNGGTTSPCNGLTGGTVTTLIAGSQYVLHMRANVHGGNSFTIDYSTDNMASFTTIKSGLTYTITANTADTYNGFEVAFNVPNVACTNCIFRLRGMGPPEWYNCAKITIVAADQGLGSACDSTTCVHGKCDSKGVCNCDSGFGGVMCDTATVGGQYGSVELCMDLQVSKTTFDNNKDKFITDLSAQTGVDSQYIKLSKESTSDLGDSYTYVCITFNPPKSADTTGVEGATIVTTEAISGNPIGGYRAANVVNVSGAGSIITPNVMALIFALIFAIFAF